jgi:hypothetical protein
MFLMSCCGPLMEMAFMCNALNFMNLAWPFYCWTSYWLHLVASNTNKPPLHPIVLHPKTTSDSCGHFFNPLHLENKFDFFPNASTS